MNSSWQWQSASGWQDYSMEVAAKLENAHQTGQHEVHFEIEQEPHKIVMGAMAQVNERTKSHKYIRRQLSEEEESRWEHMDSSGSFQPFADPSISVELERAVKEGQSCIQLELGAAHVIHDIRLDQMTMIGTGPYAQAGTKIRRMVESKISVGMPADIVWEYEDETGYKSYGRSESDHLEASFQQGEGCVRIEIGSAAGAYDIHLETMTQEKCSTGYTRNIRRMIDSKVLNDQPGSSGALASATALWEWSEHAGVYTPYEPNVASQLEDAYRQCQPTMMLQLGTQSYQISFSLMEQQNLSTGYRRKIQRTVIYSR
jgi:hypothetical protein